MKTVFRLILLFLTISSFAHFGPRGPYVGGTVTCSIALGDSAVYIGTAEGGVFESTNSNLVAWRARPVGLKSGKITALAHTGKYLFAATADSGVFRFTGFVGNDRYWEKVNSGLSNLKITSLVATDTATIYAGTLDGGIFKTTNKGASWTAVNNDDLHHLEITALAKAGSRVIHTSEGGIYATDDAGTSWFKYSGSLPDHAHASLVSYNNITDQVLVSIEDSLYLSGSASTSTTPSYTFVQTGLPTGVKIRSISNKGSSWFVATDKGVFVSPTDVIVWTAINNGLATLDVKTVAVLKTTIVAGTVGEGIFKASVAAPVWSVFNTSFPNTVTYSFTTASTNILVAATNKGVYVSRNSGTSYVRANKGLKDSLNVQDIQFADFCILAATKNGGVFFSPDTGATWMEANNGLPSLNIKKVYYSNGKKFAITADGKLFSSALHSYDWVSEQSDITAKIVSIAFFGNKLLISTEANGVIAKVIGASSWTFQNTGLTNLNTTSSTTQGSKLFVGTAGSGVFVADTTDYVWSATAPFSIDFISMFGLSSSHVQAMSSNLGYVFASYKGGVVTTSDNGATWIAGGNQFNLPSFSNIYKIAFTSGSAGRVYVYTENNGLYSNALSELPVLTSVADLLESKSASGMLVSPNPSNGTFAVKIIDKVESLELLNFAGQVVKTLPAVSEQNVSFQAASGLYFLRAKTEKGMKMQKIVIE
jgi:photosystem II stability/assembly factor-like uncharacterized protein